ncbi:hypothetical protein NVS55_02825 [Myxococcus stipitatus]|uniref:hypothetical protein n=1 Tax=Myxococcus stipitatus TaxID=83455 RepID=UPI0031454BFB
MTAFARVFRPTVLLVSLLASACGGPPEGGDSSAPEQVARQALTPVTATITSCAMQGFGRPNFTCDGTATGGTPPYTFFNWTGVANSTIFTMMPMGDGVSRANGRCTASLQAQVNYTVMDSLGASASTDAFFTCTP